MSNTTERSENVTFFTVEEFKAKLNLTDKAQVVKSPITQSLFVAIGTSRFKCQQDIDGSKEMKMLVADGNLNEACLVNVKETTDNVMFSL
jgi:hypothetical protein